MTGRAGDREREAIIASPSDPRTEYVPASAGIRVLCGCPRTVLDDGPRSWQLKVWHDRGCPRPRRARAERTGSGGAGYGLGAYLATLPAPVACPECGGVAFSRTADGRRRCGGPTGCGHVWAPGRGAVA